MLAASYDGTSVAGLTAAARLPNPSWVTAAADGRCLYAVAETTEFAGRPGGGVAAYARDPVSGAVTLLNAVSSGGAQPAHLELDPSERFVVVANYGSGSVSVFAREADGRLGVMTGHVQHLGCSAHPVRQAARTRTRSASIRSRATCSCPTWVLTRYSATGSARTAP